MQFGFGFWFGSEAELLECVSWTEGGPGDLEASGDTVERLADAFIVGRRKCLERGGRPGEEQEGVAAGYEQGHEGVLRCLVGRGGEERGECVGLL